MRYFDLHCDTLYKALTEDKTINEPLPFHISVDRSDCFDEYVQCMAIWLPDEICGEKAMQMFILAKKLLEKSAEKFNISLIKSLEELTVKARKKFIFTVENGSVLGGSLENIRFLAESGVKMLTLTWNGANEIGDGIGVENAGGMTKFGRLALKELEKNNIIIDLSHSSEKLFFEASSLCEKPFVASHSNAKNLCENKRNLSDEQIKILNNRNGLIGVNLYKDFLNNDGNKASIFDVIKHIEHFLNLGCENTLAIGGDLDGCDIPNDIKDICGIKTIYDKMQKLGYSLELLDKIFYKNSYNFFVKTLTNTTI